MTMNLDESDHARQTAQPHRLRVSSTTRRHVTLVQPSHAAVVLGALGYPVDEWQMRVSATELHTRAHAWLAHHAPHMVRDPASAAPITWAVDPSAARTFAADPRAFRSTFLAFTATTRVSDVDDWVSWEPGG